MKLIHFISRVFCPGFFKSSVSLCNVQDVLEIHISDSKTFWEKTTYLILLVKGGEKFKKFQFLFAKIRKNLSQISIKFYKKAKKNLERNLIQLILVYQRINAFLQNLQIPTH